MSPPSTAPFRAAIDSLRSRSLLLFGGKGGVGKTTISSAAALFIAEERNVILFSSDPASNLDDLFANDAHPRITIESVDAATLYHRFLDEHLASLLELTDRGTLLSKEEARPFFELAIPGIDELMSWLRISELVTSAGEAMVIVDTAPTGHALRMLSSRDHFASMQRALETMQEKHRTLVEQFTRRRVEDTLDAFLRSFERRWSALRKHLENRTESAFVPVTIDEPWVLEQTTRLTHDVRALAIDVPMIIVNHARRNSTPTPLAASAVPFPDACFPIDDAASLARFVRDDSVAPPPPPSAEPSSSSLVIPPHIRTLFFAGKGGVGKSSCAVSVAMQSALAAPERRFVLVSVDPAHTLRDTFAHFAPPANLSVELIDTKSKWVRFKETLGAEISSALDALTPRGVTLTADGEVMRQLTELAPPGADEIFAITRLAALANDESIACTFVDTAPTGHFLRLLQLPRTGGEWVREFMRLLLRYKEVIPPGALGAELLDASRTLRGFDEHLRSNAAGVVLVARPRRLVVDETVRLRDELSSLGVAVIGTIVNALTPSTDDDCDRDLRRFELAETARIGSATIVERRAQPPITDLDLRSLVPLRQTPAQ